MYTEARLRSRANMGCLPYRSLSRLLGFLGHWLRPDEIWCNSTEFLSIITHRHTIQAKSFPAKNRMQGEFLSKYPFWHYPVPNTWYEFTSLETLRSDDGDGYEIAREFCKFTCVHLTRFRLVEKQSATVRTHTCALSWTSPFKVMLHETILAQHRVATLLQHWCDIVSNGYNIVPTLQRCVALKVVVANNWIRQMLANFSVGVEF